CTKSCAGGISNRTRTEVQLGRNPQARSGESGSIDARGTRYVQRPNASGASLLEMTALGYEKKLGF
ncbi:unnamed protein product, partial [Effrenium voratum]